MNRKGLLNEIWIVLIMIGVFMAIIGIYALVGMTAPLVIGEGKDLTQTLRSAASDSGDNNIIAAANVTLNTTEGSLDSVKYLVYFGFLGLLIGYIFIAATVRTYPGLAFFWIIFMVLLTIGSMFISDAYQSQASDSLMGSYYSQWQENNFIMINLPFIVGFFGVLSGILLFVIAHNRDGLVEDTVL